FHPDHVAIGSVGDRPGNAGIDAVPHLVEALGSASGIVVDEWLVALIDVRSQKPGGFGVGTGDDQRRNAHDVGGKARGGQVANMGGRWNEDLAAEMAALLF